MVGEAAQQLQQRRQRLQREAISALRRLTSAAEPYDPPHRSGATPPADAAAHPRRAAFARAARWRREGKPRRRGGGGERSGAAEAGGAPAAQPPLDAPVSRLLVLGVVSNPRTPATRRWIRRTYLSQPAAWNRSEVVVRFLVGTRGLNAMDAMAMKGEASRHEDVEFIDASDFGDRGGIFSCIDKLFEWFPHAYRTYPGATFYGKADDDSYVAIGQLLATLRAVAHLPDVYLGYVQYDSFLLDEWKHCGWSAGPVGAIHGRRDGCVRQASLPSPRIAGPFPFVVGAITVMGASLAEWMDRAPFVKDFVRRGRASQLEKHHWDCGYSDVTLGYVLSRANRPISLVSVRGGMRDATYGAMKAQKFVVAHHLRTQASFHSVHIEALSQKLWAPQVSPCEAWHSVQARDESGSLDGRNTQALRTAMRGFDCCQEWTMCELRPPMIDPI
ncbi:hypothetical protein AB1Y20_018811 [Prymnesium parvum]|uniref:Hexosyltransferase n=1 Tax=Prymnesium parvum TaxID=97485 RepID=A0AB34JSW2_PRYPA